MSSKIFIGTPCYGGMITADYFKSVLQLTALAATKKIELQFGTIGNESLITRARNTLVQLFMDESQYTHLLFIDADIGFSWRNIERLLCADKDIACGIYPRKHLHFEKISKWVTENPEISSDELEAKILGYNLNFDDPMNLKGESGFFRVNEAATGMMLVKREVFRTMFKKFPERKYESDQIVNGEYFKSDNCYDLFAVGPYETQHVDGRPMIRYLSEDYYFSRLWQECGGEIWADMAMPLTHFGNRAFKGHVGSLLAEKK